MKYDSKELVDLKKTKMKNRLQILIILLLSFSISSCELIADVIEDQLPKCEVVGIYKVYNECTPNVEPYTLVIKGLGNTCECSLTNLMGFNQEITIKSTVGAFEIPEQPMPFYINVIGTGIVGDDNIISIEYQVETGSDQVCKIDGFRL